MAITEEQFEFIRKWIKDIAAVDLAPGKEYLVDTRLSPVIYKHELSGFGELISELKKTRKEGGLYNDVIDAMTTHETSFFRDIHPFEYLQKKLFPELMKMNLTSKRIGIWYAACSSGQEIYSVAMIIKEHFPDFKDWQIDMYATDISKPVLDKARNGEFTQLEVGRGIPAKLLIKYFHQTEDKMWVISDEIRSMVNFQYLNLIEPWPNMTPFHVIFMRNVLIYFDVDEKKRILERLKIYLKQDGILLLGGSETTLNLDPAWKVHKEMDTTFYQLSDLSK